MDAAQEGEEIEIVFPRVKLRKSDLAWALHHSQITGFTFIYEKLVEAAKQFTADTELIKCFHKHQTDHVKMHYEKQKELPDEEMYLICLHPENQSKSFERYEVPDLKQEVQDLAALRYKMLHEKLTPVSSQPRL